VSRRKSWLDGLYAPYAMVRFSVLPTSAFSPPPTRAVDFAKKPTTYLLALEYIPGRNTPLVMEKEPVERWHRLCVSAMNELDPKRLMDLVEELNLLLSEEEKAIQQELEQHD